MNNGKVGQEIFLRAALFIVVLHHICREGDRGGKEIHVNTKKAGQRCISLFSKKNLLWVGFEHTRHSAYMYM